MGYYRQPEEFHNWEIINDNIELSNKCLTTLNDEIADKDFIVNNEISLADVCVGAILYRLTNIGLNIVLPENVDRWYNQLKVREGYSKWIMSDFSSLKGKVTY